MTVILVALGLLLAGCSDGHSGRSFDDATRPGQVIPQKDRNAVGDVHGQLLTGKQYQLAQDANKIVVINLFASWCDPCQIETPQFDQLYRKVKTDGIDFVGFGVHDTKGHVKDFAVKYGVTYPVVFDEKFQVALELGNLPLVGLPNTVILDRQHRVAAVYIGEVQAADLSSALTKLTFEK
jgi:peroxiredoxin